jgi:hypothetical protein
MLAKPANVAKLRYSRAEKRLAGLATLADLQNRI